jgi:hypothetical protein
MKKLLLIACASLIFTACGMVGGGTNAGSNSGTVDTSKLKVGDTVVFKASATAYNEGKIEKIDGSKFEIRAGNNIAQPNASDVYPLPKAGSKTEVKTGDIVVAFSNDTYWTGGEVKNVSADVAEIEKASGGKLNVGLDKILKVSPAAVATIKQEIDSKAFKDLGETKSPVVPAGWKPKKGEKIAAQWSLGSWHVAVIKNVNANNVDIDWQNGWSDGTAPLDKIAPYPTAANQIPKVNDYVIVKPTSDGGEWEFALVTAINGQEAEVKMADGKTKKVKNTEFIGLS